MEFILISGLSGAGKSQVGSIMEDIGYFVVDNMPAVLIPKFAELCMAGQAKYDKVAIVSDIRVGQTFDELFQALERNKNDGSFGSDTRQLVALLNLLVRVAPTLNVADAGESIHNKDFLRVSPILDYIRDNLAEPLTLDQIAGQFYISKHYLCRIFKAATGFSVMEYIIYSRVLRARQLLQEGISVQQAGELSGFSDNSHFIRTFGHLTGLTPGRYAKEYQSGDQVLLRGEIRP